MIEVRVLSKDEKAPEHKLKLHGFSDATDNYYYLFDESDKMIATLAEPHNSGDPRRLLTVK